MSEQFQFDGLWSKYSLNADASPTFESMEFSRFGGRLALETGLEDSISVAAVESGIQFGEFGFNSEFMEMNSTVLSSGGHSGNWEIRSTGIDLPGLSVRSATAHVDFKGPALHTLEQSTQLDVTAGGMNLSVLTNQSRALPTIQSVDMTVNSFEWTGGGGDWSVENRAVRTSTEFPGGFSSQSVFRSTEISLGAPESRFPMEISQQTETTIIENSTSSVFAGESGLPCGGAGNLVSLEFDSRTEVQPGTLRMQSVQRSVGIEVGQGPFSLSLNSVHTMNSFQPNWNSAAAPPTMLGNLQADSTSIELGLTIA